MGGRISLYEGWELKYGNLVEVSSPLFRNAGTLGNPILFGVALVLLVPFILSVRQAVIRAVVLFLVLTAAALSASRTSLVGVAVFFLAGLVIYGRRSVSALVAATLVLLAATEMFGGWTEALNDPRVGFIAARYGLVDTDIATDAALNVSVRREVLANGARVMRNEWSPVDWLLGRGQLSQEEVGATVASSYNTVDNTLFGVLYEKGLIGLLLFCAAFGKHLYATRALRWSSLHWWAVPALFAMGVAFNFDAYSTFNVLVVGSMAIVAVETRGKAIAAGARTPGA
ncbi:MAG: O-antigen ligase family protein [Gemmatimonadaceae bacterium]